ncbi:MAG: hypothetical protein HYY25_10790 [Candidatus Wallbacteria bacterium]|nr:hypothetical protein [Candidatus Wallbacteria bacterium]
MVRRFAGAALAGGLLGLPFAVDFVYGPTIFRDHYWPHDHRITYIGFGLMVCLGLASFRTSWALLRSERPWPVPLLERTPSPLLLVVVLAAILRLLLAALIYGTEDVRTFQTEALDILSGLDVYRPEQKVYFYLPGVAYLTTASQWLSQATGFSYHFLMKFPSIAGDLATIAMLWWATGGAAKGGTLRLRRSLLMAVNPLSLMITGVHGQYDPLGAAALFAALLVATSGCRDRIFGAGSLAALAVYIKNWPLMLVPPALLGLDGWGRRVRAAVWMGVLLTAVSFLFVPGDRMNMLRSNMRYPTANLHWGPGGLFRAATEASPAIARAVPKLDFDRARKSIPLVSLLLFYWWTRNSRDRVRQLVGAYLLFSTVSISFATQYTTWALPAVLMLDFSPLACWFVMANGLWVWVLDGGYHAFHVLRLLTGSHAATLTVTAATSMLPWLGGLVWFVVLFVPRTATEPTEESPFGARPAEETAPGA